MAQMSYIKLNRETAESLISLRPTAYLLLSLIHLRAKRQESPDNQELAIGEAWIGDKSYCGNKEKIYRGDKEFLKKRGFAEFRGTKAGTIAKILRTDLFDPNQEGMDMGEPKGDHFPDQNTKKGEGEGEGEGEARENQPQNPLNHSPIIKDYKKRGEPKGEATDDQRAITAAMLNQIRNALHGEPKGDQRGKVRANPRATNNNPSGFKNITAALQSQTVTGFLSAAPSSTISDLLLSRYGIPPDPKGNRSPTDFELKALDYAEIFRLNLGRNFTKKTKHGLKTYQIANSWFRLFKPDNGQEIKRQGRLDQARTFFADHDGWDSYSDEQKFLYLTSFCHHGKKGFIDRGNRQQQYVKFSPSNENNAI